MEEAKAAKQVKSDNEDFLLVAVKNHKTSMMYGSAKVVISEDVARCFTAFRDLIRPAWGYLDDHHSFFISTTGQNIADITTNIRCLANEIEDTCILAPTPIRKATSSIAAGTTTDQEKRLVTNQMTLSEKTATQYYQAIGGDDQNVIFKRKRKQILSDSSDNEDKEVIQLKQRYKQVKFSSNEVDAIEEVSKPTLEICQKFLTENPNIERSATQIQDKVKQLLQYLLMNSFLYILYYNDLLYFILCPPLLFC